MLSNGLTPLFRVISDPLKLRAEASRKKRQRKGEAPYREGDFGVAVAKSLRYSAAFSGLPHRL